MHSVHKYLEMWAAHTGVVYDNTKESVSLCIGTEIP